MQLSSNTDLRSRAKFIVGGALILAAVVYLIFSSTTKKAEYFMTVDQLHVRNISLVGQSLRISGAVVGNSIQFNPDTLNISFDIANVPCDKDKIGAQGGLAKV